MMRCKFRQYAHVHSRAFCTFHYNFHESQFILQQGIHSFLERWTLKNCFRQFRNGSGMYLLGNYSFDPSFAFQYCNKVRIIYRHSGYPNVDPLMCPPKPLRIARFCKFIAVQYRTNVFWWCIGKRVIGKELYNILIVVKQFPYKVERLGVFIGSGHRSKPHLPIKP
jgi:hypothetical protein